AKKTILFLLTVLTTVLVSGWVVLGAQYEDGCSGVVILKTLHMFEVPFLLVGAFSNADTSISGDGDSPHSYHS
uniref:Cell division protein FtsQ,Lactose permease n=1 Tax=Escherichia coli (strain K12) TaxID=83333 RepID=UPI003A5C8A3A